MPRSTRPVDWRRLRQLADRQVGLLRRNQLLDAQMSEHAIAWRVASGRWSVPHPGVYLTQPGRADWHTTATGCLLAALSPGPMANAALAGAAAAYLWGLQPKPPQTIDLVVPRHRHIQAPRGSRVRRSSVWAPSVHDTAYPWRTTVSSTILDVARRGSADDAIAVAARAIQQCRVTGEEMLLALDRHPRMRHGALLRSALLDLEQGAHSAAELRFVRDVVRAHRLPEGALQYASPLGGGRAHDSGYPQWGLIVEVDGRLGHESWADRIRDGRRDRGVLRRTDEVTARYFWPDVALTPCNTAAELADILRTRGWPGRAVRCRCRDCVT